MQRACFPVAVLGRAVGQPGAGGGKGKNTLDLKILTFRQLSRTLKTLGRTSLLQHCVGLLFD